MIVSCENTPDIEDNPAAYDGHRTSQYREKRGYEATPIDREDDINDKIRNTCS